MTMCCPIDKMYAPRNVEDITQVRPGVGIVIVNSAGQILLEKRSDNHMWGLPGGRIEAGESIRQAALREIMEETGLLINIKSLLGVYSEPAEHIVTYPDNVVQLIDILLVAEIILGKLLCSEESDELRFFYTNNLPANIAVPAKKPIEDFINNQLHVIR